MGHATTASAPCSLNQRAGGWRPATRTPEHHRSWPESPATECASVSVPALPLVLGTALRGTAIGGATGAPVTDERAALPPLYTTDIFTTLGRPCT